MAKNFFSNSVERLHTTIMLRTRHDLWGILSWINNTIKVLNTLSWKKIVRHFTNFWVHSHFFGNKSKASFSLRTHGSYIIKGFLCDQNSEHRKRFLDLGLTPGTIITIECTAPMGDPLKISVRDVHLSLRRSDFAFILLSECPLYE